MSQTFGQSGGSEIRLNFVGLTDFSDYDLPEMLFIDQGGIGERFGGAVVSLIDSGLQSGLIRSMENPEQAMAQITLRLFVPIPPTMPSDVRVFPQLRESLLRLLQEGRSGLLVHP